MKYLFGTVLLASIYFFAAKFGLQLAFVNESATAVWLPTGIAIAAFLIWGRKVASAIFLGAFLANFTNIGLLGSSLGIAIGNTLEGFVGAYLVTKFAGGREAFNDPWNIIKYAFLAGLIAPIISATIGVSTLYLFGQVDPGTYFSVWFTWVLGDAAGAIVGGSFILLWSADRQFHWKRDKTLEAIFLLVSLFFVSQMVFGDFLPRGFREFPFVFMTMPFLIWAAFRFGQRETVAVAALLSGMAIYGTLSGFGPFTRAPSANDSLLVLQVFMIVSTVMATMVAAVVSKNKRFNELVLEKAREDEAILDSIGEGLVATDQKGAILYVNRAAQLMLRLDPGQMIGQNLVSVIPMEDENGHLVSVEDRPMSKALATGKKAAVNCRYLRMDGSAFPAAVTVTPYLLDERIIGVIEVFRDTTEAKALERAKDHFVSVAAHQLRTPLGIMRWNTELALKEKNQKKIAGRLKTNYQSILEMVKLVDDMLDVSRIDQGRIKAEPRKFKVIPFIKEVIAKNSLEASEKRVKVKLEVATNSKKVSIFVDEGQFREVVQNLLSNAVKYNHTGGKVDIRVSVKEDNIIISFQDTGLGIPKEDQDKVFERFFRARNATLTEVNGSGLGLFLVKSYVESWGGKIKMTSEEGKGSKFEIWIAKQS